MAWLTLPLLVEAHPSACTAQDTTNYRCCAGLVLVSLAAVVGALVGLKVSLHAPAPPAMLSGSNVLEALRPQLLPGLVGGVLGAAINVARYALSPPQLATVQSKISVPLIARVHYGGITQEVMVRRRLMTLLVWAGWRVLQGASKEHYTLCRCGRSKNKPFCDGTHWSIEFKDENPVLHR